MRLAQTIKINRKIASDEKIRLAQSLRKYRQKHHMSQVELAQLVGTSVFSISRWESTKHYPSRTALKLIKIIGI